MKWSSAIYDPQYAKAVGRVLAQAGRVHLANFVSEQGSREILRAMQHLDWRFITNAGGVVKDLTPAEAMQLAPQLSRQLEQEARTEFRFLYEGYRLSKLVSEGALKDGPLADFYAFLNDTPILEFLRTITGDRRIEMLDAMATRFRPGHFLTEHNDHQPGSDRLYAYVFNFTPVWRSDWGGWLAFYKDGHLAEAYAPKWGALNIFKVPTLHAVSQVATFAGAHRYSITGWMRMKASEPA